MKIKSVFEKYLSNTPKYANQIQIQIFHLVVFQIQIQIQIHVQIFAYLNTNTNTNTYLTPALRQWWYIVNWNLRNKLMWNYIAKQIVCVVKICWKMLSAKQWPLCSGLDVLTQNKMSHLLFLVSVYNVTFFYTVSLYIAINNKLIVA